jgi:hypothetical protein
VSYLPSGSWNFVKIPQFVEETTYGTPPASPTFVSCGAITDLALNADIGTIKNRQLGSRDIYQEVKTGEAYTVTLKYQPFNTMFMKYGTESYNSSATDNVAKSLTILWSQLINGVEYFYVLSGARTDKLEIAVTEPKVEVTQTIIGRALNVPSTTVSAASGGVITAPSYATPNPTTTPPWSGLTGGPTPLTMNGIAYDTITFKTTVSHNLDRVKPLGETVIKFLEPTNRDIMVDFEIVYNDLSPAGTFSAIADTKALTARGTGVGGTTFYQLNSVGPVKINFTNLYLEKYNSSDSPTANKIKSAAFSGVAQQVSVSG